MQIVCILIPHFIAQIELQRRPALRGQHLLVVESLGSRQAVRDYFLQVEGVYPGMALQQAVAIMTEAAILQADLSFYQDALVHILDALERRAPLVEGTGFSCIYVELDGLGELYGGLEPLLASFFDNIPLFLEASIGVGPGQTAVFTAWRIVSWLTPVSPASCRSDLPCPKASLSSWAFSDGMVFRLGSSRGRQPGISADTE